MPESTSTYQALEIPDSLRFLILFDDNLKSGAVTLHPWQVEVNEDISLGRTRINGEVVRRVQPTSKHPYKYCLCAANGSGKDAFVIAPLALWFIVTKIQSKVIITSASGTQLTTQTEAYISALAKNVNAWSMSKFGMEILKVNKRHITCLTTGSVIHLFATDEGEKAEGHHPTVAATDISMAVEHTPLGHAPLKPSGEMMIIVNEAKSVTPEIFDALNRCTGFNYWINVSSPGEPMGNFHEAFDNWPNRRRVTYFDCPHQSPDEFEADLKKYGEHSSHFRSKWLAAFTYISGSFVIPKMRLDRLRRINRLNAVPWTLKSRAIRIGIDIALSNNGDESVVSIWQGNKQIGQYTYREEDATILSDKMEVDLLKYVKKEHNYIYADDGGVGRAVIFMLNRKGWKILRVLNNSSAKNKRQYRNRGAQLWYKFSRLVELEALIPLDDDKLYSQLSSRKYKTSDTGAGLDKLQLQAKKEMIGQGIKSPDRADAAILAFTDANVEEFIEGREKSFTIPEKVEGAKKKSIEELKQMFRRGKYHIEESKGKRAYGSLSSVLEQTQPKSLPWRN